MHARVRTTCREVRQDKMGVDCVLAPKARLCRNAARGSAPYVYVRSCVFFLGAVSWLTHAQTALCSRVAGPYLPRELPVKYTRRESRVAQSDVRVHTWKRSARCWLRYLFLLLLLFLFFFGCFSPRRSLGWLPRSRWKGRAGAPWAPFDLA